MAWRHVSSATHIYRVLLAYLVMLVFNVPFSSWHSVERSSSTGKAADVGFGENLPRVFYDRKRDRRARHAVAATTAATAPSGWGCTRYRPGGVELLIPEGEFV